ncbi:MAG: hypothetical protein ACRC7R_04990 [Sarcina sp.]
MKIKCNIDNTTYNKKPVKKQFSDIQNRLALGQTEIEVRDLAKLLSSGCSFKPGFLTGMSSDTWVSQSLFALDFDGGCTIEEFLNKCDEIKVYPCFVYTTFSHKLKGVDKFRAVFCTSTVIDTLALRYTTMMTLMKLFPSGDKVVKDPARLFLGGKSLVYENYNATINPKELLDVFVAYTKKVEKYSGTASKKINDFCANIGLNTINGYPSVYIVDDFDKKSINFGSDTTKSLYTPIIYIETSQSNFQKHYIFNYFLNNNDFINIKNIINSKDKGLKKPPKTDTTNMIKSNNSIERERDFDFDKLNKCHLFTTFIAGELGALAEGKHSGIFHLATNITRYMGGEALLIDNLSENNFEDEWNKVNTIRECGAKGYQPSRCENYCPFYGTNKCDNKTKNILTYIEPKRDEIMVLEPTVHTPMDICVKESNMFLEDFLNIKEEFSNFAIAHLYINTSYTGVGKSIAIEKIAEKNPNAFDRYALCFENHDLAKEMYERFKLPNSIYLKELELQNKAILSMYEGFLQQGLYKEAYKTLADYQKSLPATNADYKAIEEIKELRRKLKDHKGAIFTTHRRITMMDKPINDHVRGYIIDEDIKNSLIHNVDLPPLQALEELVVVAEYKNQQLKKETKNRIRLTNVIDRIKLLIKTMKKADEIKDTVHPVIPPGTLTCIDNKQITDFAKEFKDKLTYTITENGKQKKVYYNVGAMLNIKAVFYSDYHNQFFAYEKLKLPHGKIMLMSATLNTTLLNAKERESDFRKIPFGTSVLYGNNFKTYKVLEGKTPEFKGKLYHYLKFYRRCDLKNTKEFEEVLKMLREKHPTIKNLISYKFTTQGTHKKLMDKYGFTSKGMYFGKCSGSNSMDGEDLIVLGTPQPPLHSVAFLAYEYGITGTICYNSDDKTMYTVERNGYKYKSKVITTQDNYQATILREIESYLIETELLQAIGRGRITRNDVEVYNYSRCVLKGSIPCK